MGVLGQTLDDKIRALHTASEWTETQLPMLRPILLNDKVLAQQFHAAALFRMPGILRSIAVLIDAGLLFEAEGCLRTLVDLTITALWIGTNEERAQRVRDDSIAQDQKRVERAKSLGGKFSPTAEAAYQERLRKSTNKPRPPSLAARAEQGDTQSRILYGLFCQLSVSTHGGIAAAVMLANGNAFRVLPGIVELTLHSAFALLGAVAEPLGIPEAKAVAVQIAGTAD